MTDVKYTPIRSIFTATPGMVLLEADYNQAELWTLGYISGDQDFIHTLQTSDLHTVMMREMFGEMDYKGKRIKEYEVNELNKLRKEDKILDAFRIGSKTVNFGAATWMPK